jgi:hypothetical protein
MEPTETGRDTMAATVTRTQANGIEIVRTPGRGAQFYRCPTCRASRQCGDAVTTILHSVSCATPDIQPDPDPSRAIKAYAPDAPATAVDPSLENSDF